METEFEPSVRDHAARRAKYLTGLLWHVGAFAIINAAFWLLDLFVGEPGAQWAYWIIAFWGFALLFHVLAWFIDGRQLERRRTQAYIDDENGSGKQSGP